MPAAATDFPRILFGVTLLPRSCRPTTPRNECTSWEAPSIGERNEDAALREVIDALRADNGRLLRLLIAGFVSDGRPEHKELTEVLAHHPNLRNWLGAGELRLEVSTMNDRGSRGDCVGRHDLRVIAVQPSPDTG